MNRRTFLRRAVLGGLGLASLAGLGGALTAGIRVGLLGWGSHAPDWRLPLQPPILVAHRGGAAVFPEHTLAAYLGSHDLYDCRFLELDVRASRDGVPVLIHDATVDRTTNGSGAVSSRNLADLERLDAGYRFRGLHGEPWAGRGLRIPTLLEVLRRLPDCVFSLEIKQEDPPCEVAVVQAVRSAGMDRRVVLGSARHAVSERIRSVAPDLATFFSFRSGARFWLAVSLGLGRQFHPMHNVLFTPERLGSLELVTPRLLAASRALGIPVLVFTVNDAGRMAHLLRLGVSGIVTDRPDTLAALLRRERPTGAGVPGNIPR